MGLAAEPYTFLFTDIVGSTALMQTMEDAMVSAVAAHDVLLTPVFQARGGHVFKHTGDGYCVAFAFPHDALNGAIDAQRALQNHAWDLPQPLRVRMAVHTGPAVAHDDDYRGLALSRAARLVALAHGGQVLLSEATELALRDALPDGLTLRDLGSARLPGLERAERVYQLLAPGLDQDFPPPRTRETPPHNLKEQLTSFIGRERELSEVVDLCRAQRLVTVTGPGGCGKTRLALQAAAHLLEEFPDGVWMIELAGLTDPALIPAAVASELKVRQEGVQTLDDALFAYLEPRRLLLILDNCEHVVDASAHFAHALLQNAPDARILATSRERLNVGGETVWRIPTLTPPAGRGAASVSAVLASDAATLFVERAASIQPRFVLSAGNAQPIAQVCRRLEGLPLALELAAAWVGRLPVEQIAARLEDHFRLLSSGPRPIAERHRSLQAALDWSYDLLTEQERALLCRLSVFSGGWTLEAAEAVCAGDGLDESEILDLLSQLIDKSLVAPEEQNGGMRYRLLETLRAYSLEKMPQSSDGSDWRGRHAAHFLDWAEAAESHLSGSEQAEWLNNIERDHDNLRAALTHLSATDAEVFQRLASALYPFWYTRGYLTEGRTWLEEAVAKADDARTIMRAKAINRTGIFAWVQGDDRVAEERLQHSLSICIALGAEANVAAALNNLSMISSDRGDFERAEELLNQALVTYRRIGDLGNSARVLHNLGASAADLGNGEMAVRYYRESLAIYQSLKDEGQEAHSLRCLSQSLYRTGHFAEAEQTLRESLRACSRLGDRKELPSILCYLGYLALDAGNARDAVRLIAAGERLRLEIGNIEPEYDIRLCVQAVARAQSLLSQTDFDTVWNEGTALSLEESVTLGGSIQSEFGRHEINHKKFGEFVTAEMPLMSYTRIKPNKSELTKEE